MELDAKFFQIPLSFNKKSVKSSWMRISTKIRMLFFLIRHPTLKKIHKNSSTASWVISKLPAILHITQWYKKLSYRWQTLRRICAICVADPSNTTPPHICYHVEFGRSSSKGVGINRGASERLGSTGTPPLGMGARLTTKKHARPQMYFNAEFGCSRSYCTGATKGSQKILGRWGPPLLDGDIAIICSVLHQLLAACIGTLYQQYFCAL